MTQTAFLSYSHEDAGAVKDLKKHLKPLERSGIIEIWYDGAILAGQDIDIEINRKLTSADIISLLISASFIASDYCVSVEMNQAIERHKKGEAIIIPIILRLCQWIESPIGRLRATPTDGDAILSRAWEDKEEAWNIVATDIKRMAQFREESVTINKIKEISELKSDEEDELGILDYQILFEEGMSFSLDILNEINIETIYLGELVKIKAEELNGLGPAANNLDRRKIINEVASYMDKAASAIGGKIPELRKKTIDAILIMNTIIQISDKENTDPDFESAKANFRLVIKEMANSAQQAKAGMLGFRDSVFNFPRVTKEVNRSKNHLVAALDGFCDFVDELTLKISSLEF